MNIFEDSGAEFSLCRKYRYALWRIWDKSKPMVMFIGLNPSTANEYVPDPTITRVKGFAESWGFGGVYMMNCFPFVTENPDKLIIDHGTQYLNNLKMEEIGAKCSEVIFAWGAFKEVKKFTRDKELIAMFPNAKALVINKDGSPRHPLYVPGKTIPVKYVQ